ncbi:MAG: serine O-acetyltransferase [Planctomycetota bacterium]|jgi:serine O-acetyltransferase|nr:serine O-acetyltransferase [Planctomycetota bacterium]
MDAESLDRIAGALSAKPVIRSQENDHVTHLPDRASVGEVCRRLLSLLFPGFFSKSHLYCGHVDTFTRQMLLEGEDLLRDLVTGARRFHAASQCKALSETLEADVTEQLAAFFERLPVVAARVATDVDAAFDNDPAAQTREEIVAAYPGVQAIAVQRLAHELYALGVPLVPRMMTEVAHGETGIDIHPGAVIGERFAIDHGTGIVIGETTTIGCSCMLYHGVTLGAFNPLAKNDEGELVRGGDNKRHPDLEDHVTVYPGATILGGDTVIGHHSVVGGNAWLTHSVEPYSRVTIKDPDLVFRSRHRPEAHDFTI